VYLMCACAVHMFVCACFACTFVMCAWEHAYVRAYGQSVSLLFTSIPQALWLVCNWLKYIHICMYITYLQEITIYGHIQCIGMYGYGQP